MLSKSTMRLLVLLCMGGALLLNVVWAKDFKMMDSQISQDEIIDLGFSVDGQILNVTWNQNVSTVALSELVKSKQQVVVKATLYGGFEQSGPLPQTLPSEDRHLSSKAGDIILYQDCQLVVFFDDNAWSYTKLGQINGLSEAQLRSLLNKPATTITIFDKKK